MSPLKIIVIGGGLAGLAAAISIRQAGHDVVVLERMDQFREIGAGVQIPANASKALRHLGVLEEIRKSATEPGKTVMRRYEDGRRLVEFRNGPSLEQRYGSPHLLVHRAELHRHLVRKAEASGVVMRLGSDVRQIALERSGARVELADGTALAASLVVGADGDKSMCRERLLGRDDPLKSTGDMIYRAAVNFAKLPEGSILPKETVEEVVDDFAINYWVGPDAEVVTYMLASDSILNIVLAGPLRPEEPEFQGVKPLDKDEVVRLFADWDPRIGDMLRASNTLGKWVQRQSSPNDIWSDSHKRLLLIGDAAHAMLPRIAQGAAQSFEDAVTLGRLLQDALRDEDVAGVVTRYETLRKQRTATVRKRSEEQKDVFVVPDGEEQRLRDEKLALGMTPGSPFALTDPDFQNWLWGHDAWEAASASA